MDNYNQLTPGEAERLAMLAEECAEVIKAVGKILRHGYESKHPQRDTTNRKELELECGDVLHRIKLLTASGDLDYDAVIAQLAHRSTVNNYTHHQD